MKNINFKDPNGNRIQQFLDRSFKNGNVILKLIFSERNNFLFHFIPTKIEGLIDDLSLQLNSRPALGDWLIQVIADVIPTIFFYTLDVNSLQIFSSFPKEKRQSEPKLCHQGIR
jgi:hypothetical protein